MKLGHWALSVGARGLWMMHGFEVFRGQLNLGLLVDLDLF